MSRVERAAPPQELEEEACAGCAGCVVTRFGAVTAKGRQSVPALPVHIPCSVVVDISAGASCGGHHQVTQPCC